MTDTFNLSREDFEKVLGLIDNLMDTDTYEDRERDQAFYDYLRDHYGHTWGEVTKPENIIEIPKSINRIYIINDGGVGPVVASDEPFRYIFVNYDNCTHGGYESEKLTEEILNAVADARIECIDGEELPVDWEDIEDYLKEDEDAEV